MASAQGIPNKKRTMMPGELFGETHGKRIVSRVLSFDPVKAEVALRGQRQMFRHIYGGCQTRRYVVREGYGLMVTQDGDYEVAAEGKTHLKIWAWCGLPLVGP